MTGGCGIFAIALHKVFGYELGSYLDDENIEYYDEDEYYDRSECEGLSFEDSIGKLKVDREGLQKHWDRKRNGYRLFGKYYEALWD